MKWDYTSFSPSVVVTIRPFADTAGNYMCPKFVEKGGCF